MQRGRNVSQTLPDVAGETKNIKLVLKWIIVKSTVEEGIRCSCFCQFNLVQFLSDLMKYSPISAMTLLIFKRADCN